VLQRWSEESNVAAHLETTGAERPLPAVCEATLLKATQEALANVRKHARASQVNVTLSFMEDEVILDVQDNGAGFDPSQAAQQAGPEHGYGLVALRERVGQLGGSLEVESAPGEGATLVVSLPVVSKEPAEQAGGEG
jgi:signal transduction histidine kinase